MAGVGGQGVVDDMVRGVAAPVEPKRRISLELPESLVARVERQCELMGMGRQDLITAAIEGLVREFEAIDADSGVACPRCGGGTEVDMIDGENRRVCVRCHWSWPE